MLASKFCVVVNKCPMFNREQMPNIQLKFASSRLLCSLRCYNSRFMLCSPVFNREQIAQHTSSNSPLRGFSAACAATILALCCTTQCSLEISHASMQICKFHCVLLFTKKTPLTEYYFCQGRIILTIRGATLNSR